MHTKTGQTQYNKFLKNEKSTLKNRLSKKNN